MNPKKPARSHGEPVRSNAFGTEYPTRPSLANPFQSGKRAPFRESDPDLVSTGARPRFQFEGAPRSARISPDDVPRALMHFHELVKLPLHARAAFVLGHIDGDTTVQTLLDISGMPDDEVMGLLAQLEGFGVIDFK